MRIGIDAHYVGVRHGGNELHFESLIRHLAARAESDVEYFVFNHRGAAEVRLEHERLRIVPLSRRSVYWQRGVEIPLHSRRLNLDVLHVPFNFLPVFRCKKVVTIHDLGFLHTPDAYGTIERVRMTALTRVAVHRADHLLAVSQFTKREIAERYGVAPERVTVTANAVDRGLFRPLGEQATRAFRTSTGLGFEFFLFVGTLQPRKNVLTLLDAYARLRERRGPGVPRLVLVGRRGWKCEQIFRRIEEHRFGEAVRYLGPTDRHALVGLYNVAIALVFPSIYEGFGIPILEAMSCGCPVVSSNAASMPEVYGDAALTFDPREPEQLAAQLDRLLDDSTLHAALVEKGFANCARFSWERTAAIVERVYRAL